MKMLNMVSDSPTYVPTISKMFWPEVSAMPEISTDFDPYTVIEFHIYSFILPILEAILGINLAKTLRKFYQYDISVQTDVFKNVKLKLLRNSSSAYNQTRFLILCLAHHQFHHHQSRIDCGTKLSSIFPSVFRRSVRMKHRWIVP